MSLLPRLAAHLRQRRSSASSPSSRSSAGKYSPHFPVVPARRADGPAVGVHEEVGRGPLVQPSALAAGVAEAFGALTAEGPARRRAARVRRRHGRAALVAARVEALRALRADPLDAVLLRRVVAAAVTTEVEKGLDVGWGRESSPWHSFLLPAALGGGPAPGALPGACPLRSYAAVKVRVPSAG